VSQPIFTDGIGYEGKVTLTLKSKNHIIESKTYKNSGTIKLFQFLGNCLIGAYDQARPLRPMQIALLSNPAADLSTALEEPTTNIEMRTSFQPLAQLPRLISDDTSAQVSVIYSFELDSSSIESDFNQIALYSESADSPEKFSAYYFLVDGNGNLSPMNPADWSATAVLLIDWELTLSNKNVVVNNDDTNTGVEEV
jgi:hypothetical protein